MATLSSKVAPTGIVTQSNNLSDLANTSAALTNLGISNHDDITVDGSGNVGIGTSSPSKALHVETATNGGIVLSDTTNSITGIYYSSASNSLAFGSTTNHPVKFQTNNTERMRIDSSGNVGIGTSSPSSKLHVSGDIQTNNISLEGGKHHITANDGGGNFNIRVANDFTSGCTEAGYVSHWVYTQGSGQWLFKTSTTSLAVGASPTFQNNLILDRNGNLTALGNVTAYSDIRLKDNIEKIDDALSKVNLLGGYTFDRTDVDTPRQTGVIAQEVQAVLPEAVTETDEGTLTVAHGNMMGLMIEAIKELKAEIDELKGVK